MPKKRTASNTIVFKKSLQNYYDYNAGYVTMASMNTYTKLLQKGAYGRQQVALILSKPVPERYRLTYSWSYEYPVTGYIREIPGLMVKVSGSDYFNIFQNSMLTSNVLYTVNPVTPGTPLNDFILANQDFINMLPLEPTEWLPSNIPNSSMIYVPVAFSIDHNAQYF